MIAFPIRLLARCSRLYSLFLITQPFAVAAAFDLGSINRATKSLTLTVNTRSAFSTALAMASSPQRFPATAAASLTFGAEKQGDTEFSTIILLGKKTSLEQHAAAVVQKTLNVTLDEAIVSSLLKDIDESKGGTATTLVAGAHRVTLCGLPSPKSRSLSPLALHAIPPMIKSSVANKGNTQVVVLLPAESSSSMGPLALAVSKAFPIFSLKTSTTQPEPRKIHVSFVNNQGETVNEPSQFQDAQAVADGVRLTGRLVDMHPELLTTEKFLRKQRQSLKIVRI
jgi:leucyl aminopeptidase